MLTWLSYIDTCARLAEVLLTGLGLVILAVLAACKKFSSSGSGSQKEIAEEAEQYVQRHGDAAFRWIGAEMHRERIAHGIGPRYRSLRAISEHLCHRRAADSMTEMARAKFMGDREGSHVEK